MIRALPRQYRDGVDDRALAAREHENFIASIGMVAAHRQGGLVRHRDGIAVLAAGGPLRVFNQVFVESSAAPDAALADGVATMRAGGYRFVVHLRTGDDDARVPLLAGLGLVEPEADDGLPGMALHPIGGMPPLPPALEIRKVEDAAGLAEHVRVTALGFGLDEGMVRGLLGSALLDVPGVRFYVGYVDGVAVAGGAGVASGTTIGVYNIATLESARRRGYGAALTARVVEDGRADGHEVAVLQASDVGLPIYERLGFRTVVRYRAFVDPDPPHA